MKSVFQFFDSDRSGRMEFNEFNHAMVKLGYQFNQQIITLIFTNLDQNRAGFLDLDGFIKACSVIQIVLSKMQQYDPQRRGVVTLDVNQLLDVLYPHVTFCVFTDTITHYCSVGCPFFETISLSHVQCFEGL